MILTSLCSGGFIGGGGGGGGGGRGGGGGGGGGDSQQGCKGSAKIKFILNVRDIQSSLSVLD
jgi:hypothetical protein